MARSLRAGGEKLGAPTTPPAGRSAPFWPLKAIEGLLGPAGHKPGTLEMKTDIWSLRTGLGIEPELHPAGRSSLCSSKSFQLICHHHTLVFFFPPH